ncbi:uncharacterized protein PV07_08739 [Cladophialophora immunda]|uniref:Uncharacterized protein n=1 Tax=Cladophialophora immunda TaxID=569365 RepID=A0A0D2C302_9EURO|nr:uncharacterized protein PV07_08739 [Cladophialophora immunda]KIW25573.1 hypothetical protein PV07_08739 [Cladophialophora immunda]
MEWEREEMVPDHLFQTFHKHNMLTPNLPAPLPVEWLRRVGVYDILGTPEEKILEAQGNQQTLFKV